MPSIAAVQPLHFATWIKGQTKRTDFAAPSVKRQLAGIWHLFDWLVMGPVMAVNPAGSVRGPSHIVRSGKTPVREPAEARALLNSIDVMTSAGLRDWALIGLMVYSIAWIGAAIDPDRRGDRDESRRRIRAAPASMGAAVQERRQTP